MEAVTLGLSSDFRDFPDVAPFREACEAVTQLSGEQRAKLVAWLSEALKSLEPPASNAVKDFASGLGVPEVVIRSTTDILQHLLLVQHRRGISSNAVAARLQQAGVSEDAAKALGELTEEIVDLRSAVNRIDRNAAHVRAGIQPVEGIQMVCDLRAVFDASPTGGEGAVEGQAAEFLGWAPIVIVGLDTSDSPFERRITTYQFSESQFERLAALVQEAQRRLRELKGRLEGASTPTR